MPSAAARTINESSVEYVRQALIFFVLQEMVFNNPERMSDVATCRQKAALHVYTNDLEAVS